ncbi:MAG: TIGR01620 family protein [Pseudorhodobacter sp.]|nr:TIGR01620 family protein [Pseudorhodobacter sp.]
MSDTPPPRKPLLVEMESDAPDPGAAPPVPDLPPEGAAMQALGRAATARRSTLGRLAGWAFGALGGFVLSLAAWDYVTGLLARNSMLGSIAFALLGLAVVAAVALALREAAAFLRLGRLDSLRGQAELATASADLAGARRVVAGITRLYAGRADQRAGLARVAAHGGEIFDADALLALAESELVAPLDQAVRREIEGAARQVATVTALVPLALADVAMALFANLRMIRRIAEIYGGRAGALGSWRLLRRVFSHLIATGAVALTDDLISSVAGGGVISKLSRRFGEGVVNGALTARVGVAAMEVCRPLPFVAAPRPRVANLVSRALAGLFGRTDGGTAD